MLRRYSFGSSSETGSTEATEAEIKADGQSSRLKRKFSVIILKSAVNFQIYWVLTNPACIIVDIDLGLEKTESV